MRVIDKKDLIRGLLDNGYIYTRCTGDHLIYKNGKGGLASIPVRCNPYIASRIAKQCGIKEYILERQSK